MCYVINCFMQEGNGEIHLHEPVHVCVDRSDNLLILDASPPRILKYSNTGQCITVIMRCRKHASVISIPVNFQNELVSFVSALCVLLIHNVLN